MPYCAYCAFSSVCNSGVDKLPKEPVSRIPWLDSGPNCEPNEKIPIAKLCFSRLLTERKGKEKTQGRRSLLV